MVETTTDQAIGCRVLLAGIGNVLRGDDGFGPAVIRVLEASGQLPTDVDTVELGIGGIGLVLQLLDGYDALIIVDAVDRDGDPGSLYVLEPHVPNLDSIDEMERYELASDTHQLVPSNVLIMASAAQVLPSVIRIVGCQPFKTDELSTELSPIVERSVPAAVNEVLALLRNLTQQ